MVHIYFDQGQYLPSVTTIIHACMPEPERLTQWKNNNPDWSKKTDKAASIGTILHYRILNGIAEHQLELPDLDWEKIPADANKRADLAQIMWDNLNLKIEHPIKVEHLCVNHEHRFAGKFDLCATIDGIYTLLDIKSSKLFHDSHRLQMAAYYLLLDRTPDRAMLVSLHPNEAGNPHLRAHVEIIEREKLDELAEQFILLAQEFHRQKLTEKLRKEHGVQKD